MNYLYKTNFECDVLSCVEGDDSFISKASLDNLKSLIPSSIDFSENIDILGVAFNAAVINKFNRNDDGMDSESAVKVINNFLHKPTNIEHKKDKIVGHIVNAGFSRYEDSSIMSIEEAMETNDPYNISLGSVVYKYANKNFAKLLQRSVDPKDSLYHSVSTSWEVGFNAFSIAVGSSNLKEAEIINSKKQFEELRKKLKAYGGNGKLDDGTKIYRILSGEIFPLGVGFTSNPAADVKGIYTDLDSASSIDILDKRDSKAYFDIKNPNFNEKNKLPVSQSQITNVKNKNETIMEIEQIVSELKNLLVEKKFSEESVASMTNVFAEAIKQKDIEYKASLTKAQDEASAAVKEREDLKNSVQELQTKLGDAITKIADFENYKKQEEAVARFNARMESIDQEYALDDDDRKVLVSDLKDLDVSDEAFASYQGKIAIMWKHKNKEVQAAYEKSIEDRISQEVAKKISNVSTASIAKTDKELAEEALATTTSEKTTLPNSNESTATEVLTLRDKFANAFDRKNIIIS